MVKANKLGLAGKVLLGVGLALGSGSCAQYDFIIPREHVKFFTCNYWEDLNNDGKTKYPEEFIGIKNKFKKDEKLELVLHVPVSGIAGKKADVIIYGPKGKPALVSDRMITHDGETVRFGTTYNLIETLIEKGGFGKYKAVGGIVGDKYIHSHEFEITE